MEHINPPYQRINTDKADLRKPLFHVYKRRWLVLMAFSTLTCSNALLWNSFSPIALIAMDYFKASPTAIDAMSLLFLLIYIPGAFVGSYSYSKLGLKKGILIGVALNTVGSWLRWVGCVQPWFPSPQVKYGIVFAGQTLAATAQSFIYQAPPLLASNWFPPTERTTATSIGSLANQLGIAIGFVLSTEMVNTASDLPFFMIVCAMGCSLACSLFIFFFQGTPDLPPTAVAANNMREDKSTSYWRPYLDVLKNRDFNFLFIAFSISLGCIFALSTLLDQLLNLLEYSNDDSGVFGLLTIMVGIGAALLLSLVTDRTRSYKLLLLITFAGCALAYALFALVLRPSRAVLVGVLCSIVGFFNTALAPVSLEAAVELTYPINEEVSSTLLTNGANMMGMVFILAMAPLLTADLPRVFLGILAAFNLLGFGLLVFMRPRYKRLMAEQEHTKPLLA